MIQNLISSRTASSLLLKTLLISTIISIINAQSPSYQYNKVYQLDQDYSPCNMIVTNITMFGCNNMAYFYITEDLLNNSTQSNLTGRKVQGATTGLRENFESAYPGSLTYVSGNQIYRAYINKTIIVIENLFYIDSSEITSGVMIVDAVVMQNYSIIKFDNDTFQIYTRPKTLKDKAVRSKLGQLLPPLKSEQFYYYFHKTQDQQLTLYLTPNWSTQQNQLYLYTITNSTDYYFINVTTINIQSTIITQMSVTQSLLVVGCGSCNTYNGRIDLFDATTYQRVLTIDGKSSNTMLGQDVMSKGENEFVVSSTSGGLINTRAFYLNEIRIVKSNRGYGYEMIEKVVDGWVKTPQGGLKYGIYQDTLIVKYEFYRQIFAMKTCDYQQYLNTTDNKCSSCNSSTNSFDLQSKQCSSCQDLWTQIQNSPSNIYMSSMFKQICADFSPSLSPLNITNTTNDTTSEDNISEFYNYTKTNISDYIKSNTYAHVELQSTSTDDVAPMNLIVPIAIGASVGIAILMTIIIVCCCVHKMNKRKRLEIEAKLKEKRAAAYLADPECDSKKVEQAFEKQEENMTERELKDTTMFTSRYDSTNTARRIVDDTQQLESNYNSVNLRLEVQKEIKNIQSFFNDQTGSPQYEVEDLNIKKLTSSEVKQMTFMKGGDMESCEIDEFDNGIIDNTGRTDHMGDNE